MKNAIEPTGYLWEKVAQSYLETACPEKSAKVTYDSEAGIFACYGMIAEMENILEVLVALLHNDERLETLIQAISYKKSPA